MQTIAKLWSGAASAFITALFASVQFISISIVLMVLSSVLAAALLGRVTGVFIAEEMNRNNEPVLRTVVRTKDAAAAHVHAVLQIPDLVIDLKGHVIISGRAVARRTQWMCLSNYIGLLARPFDVMSLALPTDSVSRVNSLNLLSSSQSDTLGNGSSRVS